MSILSLILGYLIDQPIARHAACLILFIGFACILIFTRCCSVIAFARSRAVAVLVAAWSLTANLGQFYGLHDNYAAVFLLGALVIIVTAVLIAAYMIYTDKTSALRQSAMPMVNVNPMYAVPVPRFVMTSSQLPASARAITSQASSPRLHNTPTLHSHPSQAAMSRLFIAPPMQAR